MSVDSIKQILNPAIQKFIVEHEHDDVRALLLKHTSIEGIKASLVAEQISGRSKAKLKLPLYYKTSGIVYPPGLNMEQCSSEATAIFKSHQVVKGKCMLDLTGGFGIDIFFMSRQFEKAIYIEPNTDLLEIVKQNHITLGALNIEHRNTTAEEFLTKDNNRYDVIFIDPSRRNANQKVFKLADCIPDITALQALLFERTDVVLLKASPLLDIQTGLNELLHVKKVIVVSVDNECKEVLFKCVKGFTGEPTVEAINLKDNEQDSFSFLVSDEQKAIVNTSTPLSFLYEPNASILKAGAFKSISTTFGLAKIHSNTHLYTSEKLHDTFPGRIFKILALVKPDAKIIKSYIPEGKANVTTRNYPLSVEELKKKTNLKDGGDKFLIAFTGIDQKYVVVAERLQ